MTGRRRFVRNAAMTVAAARLGGLGRTEAAAREPRELAALGRAAGWLNSPRLTPARLAGQVVLVDFCTYTCINWLRTLPYRRAWAQTTNRDFFLSACIRRSSGSNGTSPTCVERWQQMGIGIRS